MPIDIRVLGKEGRDIYKEWKSKVEKHNKYVIKNKYYKERKMDMWHKELNDLNDHYRKVLKSMESQKKKEMIELEKAAKEAARMAKEAEEKAKEERALKRKMNKETRRAELAKMIPRKSIRLAKKEKKPRCPKGTHRNKKTGNCEKKSMQSRKRCPNGTRRSKKSGKCE